jgi:Ethanolamine utilization protein EutJ (predicted chaperonin)
MTIKRWSVLTVAGLASGIWLAGNFIALPLASAQPTQTEIKERTKQKAKKGQERWQSMTPEQQEAAKEKGEVAVDKSQEKWQSMTPEQQQAAKEKGKSGAKKAQKKWQSLPQ